MDDNEIRKAEKIPLVELENYWKLTTERCFYVRANINIIMYGSTVYANYKGSYIKENNMNLQKAIERYNQRARNRSTANDCDFPEVAKVGEF